MSRKAKEVEVVESEVSNEVAQNSVQSHNEVDPA